MSSASDLNLLGTLMGVREYAQRSGYRAVDIFIAMAIEDLRQKIDAKDLAIYELATYERRKRIKESAAR